MSRSHRKTPKSGIADVSEKRDKQIWHRRLRRAVKVGVEHGREVLPLVRDVSNTWAMGKDGKIYWGKRAPKKLMRK
jgi:hypothetical protein